MTAEDLQRLIAHAERTALPARFEVTVSRDQETVTIVDKGTKRSTSVRTLDYATARRVLHGLFGRGRHRRKRDE